MSRIQRIKCERSMDAEEAAECKEDRLLEMADEAEMGRCAGECAGGEAFNGEARGYRSCVDGAITGAGEMDGFGAQT